MTTLFTRAHKDSLVAPRCRTLADSLPRFATIQKVLEITTKRKYTACSIVMWLKSKAGCFLDQAVNVQLADPVACNIVSTESATREALFYSPPQRSEGVTLIATTTTISRLIIKLLILEKVLIKNAKKNS